MATSNPDRDPVELLAEDFLARRRRGEMPSIEEYAQSYPDLAGDIREVFPSLILMEHVAPGTGDLESAETVSDCPAGFVVFTASVVLTGCTCF